MTGALPADAVAQPDQLGQPGDEGEVALRQYVSVLLKYRWSILGLGLVAALVTTLVAYSLTPIYRAIATLLIETQGQNVVSIEEVYGLPGGRNREYLATQNQILQSKELGKRVIDKLNIAQHPEFDPNIKRSGFSLNPKKWLPDPSKWIPAQWRAADADKPKPRSPEDLRNRIARQFAGQLEVKLVRGSQLITVSFESQDPALAAAVPNALAEAYVESNFESRLAMTQQASGWITERLDGLRDNLEESERALQAFRDKERLVDVRGVDSLAARELDKITTDLVDARRKLSEAGEFLRQIESLQGRPVGAFASIPAVLRDGSVQRARAVQAEKQANVSELAKRYGPKHPRMIAAIAEAEAANNDLNKQISNVIKSVEKQYRVAQAEERELTRALNASRGEMASLNRKESTLLALEREVQTNRELYDMFLTRFKETDIAGDMQTTNARLVDPAVLPAGPYKPKKALMILIALILGLAAGTALAFLIEALDNTIKDSADVEQILQLPTFSTLPVLAAGKDNSTTIVRLRHYETHGKSWFAESIRSMRTSVLLTDIDEQKKTILVTSSIPNEGKSVTAANLALSLAEMGKTLLLDADMRKPAEAEAGVFVGKARSAGLSQLISGQLKEDKCIHHYEPADLHVMPAGMVSPNPLELLSSNRFARIMQRLKDMFDYIVINSAPLIAFSDALVISHHVRSILYVIKADDTPRQMAAEGIKRLRRAGAGTGKDAVIGIVLNQTKPNKRYGYGRYEYSPYYGRGGRYYGYGYGEK